MTIKDRLNQIKRKGLKYDYYIIIYDNTCGYNPLDFGFFMSDIDEYTGYYIDEQELNRNLNTENHYVKHKLKTISLGFDGVKNELYDPIQSKLVYFN